MGTLVAIEARSPDAAQAEEAVNAAFAVVHNVESLLHPTRAGSDLARLNRAAAGCRLPVHPWTVALIQLSQELCAQSRGLFEPALPGTGSIMHWLPAGAFAVVVRQRARVDFGGIAKGYAVDLAVAAMRRAGVRHGLINAGGDLRVFGDLPWPVTIRTGDSTMAVELRNCALATSDPGCKDQPAEHRGYYTGGLGPGRPSPQPASVVAPTAAIADALTKIVMFAARANSVRLLAHYGARPLIPAGPDPHRAPRTYSW